MGKTLIRLVVSGPLVLLGLLATAWLVLPWPVVYRWRDPDSTSVMRYRMAQADRRGDPLVLRYEPVPLADVSQAMRRAVVIAEDGRFRDHRGVDWYAVADEVRYRGGMPPSPLDADDRAAVLASWRYVRGNRDRIRGRSTITQQLAKNLYFSLDRSLLRKVGEMVVAQRLEWLLSKDRILELYLNTVELGPGIFGVEAGARHYFGVAASELTPRQAASLAGTLPHPLTSNPATNPSRMAWRRDLILARMEGGGEPRRGSIPVAPTVAEPRLDEAPDAPGPGDAPVEPDDAPPVPDTVSPATPPDPPDTSGVADTTAGNRTAGARADGASGGPGRAGAASVPGPPPARRLRPRAAERGQTRSGEAPWISETWRS